MGGYKVYGPQLAELPPELKQFRQTFGGYLAGQVGRNAPAYTGEVAAQMPSYMQNAGQLMSQLLNMNAPQNLGQTFPQLVDTQKMIQQMVTTGMPTSAAPAWEAAKQQVQSALAYEMPQVLQQALGTGTRYTSGLMNKATEAASRRYAELGSQYAQQAMAAEEAARQRQLQAGQMGMGLAELQQGLPLQALAAAGQMGTTQFNMQQAINQALYQEWLRQQYANRPEFQAALQYAMGYPVSAQAPAVAPPLWASLLGNLIGAAGTAGGGYLNYLALSKAAGG